jgi:ribosomal protein L40E
MTAPRVCRTCGADLPPDIRWCTRCYEPVRELSPRAPIHDGDFVDRPVHERGAIPRWSRWEKTATTFGPWGRIGATVLVFATLLPAIAFNGFVYAICFPVAATVLLREIWAKGWFVPEEPREAPTATIPDPEPVDGSRPQPFAVTRFLRWGVAGVGLVAFAYGPIEVKAAVVGFAAISLLVWFWTAFDYR